MTRLLAWLCLMRQNNVLPPDLENREKIEDFPIFWLFFFKNCMKSIGTSKMKFKDSCTTLLCPERSTMLEILMKNLWCKKIILNFIILWKPSKVISPISTTQLFSSLPEIGRHWGQEDMKRQTRPGRNGRCGHLRGHIGLILGPSGPNSPRGLWAMSIVQFLEGCVLWLHSKTENTLSLNLLTLMIRTISSCPSSYLKRGHANGHCWLCPRWTFEYTWPAPLCPAMSRRG